MFCQASRGVVPSTPGPARPVRHAGAHGRRNPLGDETAADPPATEAISEMTDEERMACARAIVDAVRARPEHGPDPAGGSQGAR